LIKSLVTGGCGFIGSHLVELLINEGHQVTVLDNFSTGRQSNLEHLINSEKLKIIQGDLLDLRTVKEVVRDFHYVYHMAALADIVPSILNPKDYFDTNVTGTVNLLEAIKESSIRKLVYAASSSCYGIPKSYPTQETSEINPQYPYAFTKWAGESAILHWGKVYKIPVISLRLFNVYGPRSRTSGTYGAVFGVFLAQKLAGKPFTVIGNGQQTRDFTYVTDVARAFLAASKSEFNNEIFNVGSGNTYSINYLTELLGGVTAYIPKRPGEPDCTFADINKIHKLLKWTPQVEFEAGVKTLISNIEYWRDAPVWESDTIKVATKSWFKLLGDSD
jgi:UDP-glucose 4-epimerase